MKNRYWLAIATVIAFIAGVSLGIIGIRIADHANNDWPKTFESIKDFFTALGILGAGTWTIYLIKRRGSLEARAQLAHRHQKWQRGDDLFLRIFVDVSNPSEVAITPGDGQTKVQTIPVGEVDSSKYAEESWQTRAEIRHANTYEEISIEPKEHETYCHDVLLPVSTRYIQIHTFLACDRKSTQCAERQESRPTEPFQLDEDAQRWSLTTLIDLEAGK